MTEIQETKAEYSLNRGNLKMIALFCMGIDHFAVAIMEPLLRSMAEEDDWYMAVSVATIAMRLIGRIAFPIFCFFIVEGMIHTRSVLKYALRLIFIGIISEVPFDMVLKHKFYNPEYQNVFWTLLIGLITIYAMDGISKKFRMKDTYRYIFQTIACLAGLLCAQGFETDYGCIGVLTIVLIYLIGENEYKYAIVLNVIGQVIKFITLWKVPVREIAIDIISLVVVSMALWMCQRIPDRNSRRMFGGCAALVTINAFELPVIANVSLMKYYNGEKGKKIGALFYIFYPVHLLLFAGLCKLVGLY